MNDYWVVEFDGTPKYCKNVNIRVSPEGCLQVCDGTVTVVTYSPSGWLKCWRVDSTDQKEII
jgi:hypothetical protein